MRNLQMQIATYAHNRATETHSCCNYTHKIYEWMNRHVMKIRLLAKKRLLILLSIMRHGLLLFVMSFNIIKWEVLKISNFFICARWVNLFHRFLCLDDLDNQLVFAFTLAEFCITGLANPGNMCIVLLQSSKWKTRVWKQNAVFLSVFSKFSLSHAVFQEAGCARMWRIFVCFASSQPSFRCFVYSPSGHDKAATGEQAKPKAGCQKELFKVNVQVAEKLSILFGVCRSGKSPNQSTLPRKPWSTAKYHV